MTTNKFVKEDWHDLADPEMIPWCAKLNSIPGIETRQSCSGHKPGDVSKCETYGYETSGCVWLVCDWMSQQNGFDLARIPTVERVSLIFFPEGDAVWDIVFMGKNRDKLDESMTAILKILANAARCLTRGSEDESRLGD